VKKNCFSGWKARKMTSKGEKRKKQYIF